MRALTLALLVACTIGLMDATNAFGATLTDPRVRGASVVLGVGFVLITSLFVGKLVASVGLPKLTGYLFTGIIAGPAVAGYLDQPVVDGLRLINGVAIALIALTAGLEMDLRSLRPLLKSIAAISAIAVVGTALVLGLTTYLLVPLLPFMAELGGSARIAVALVTGVVVVAQSPAVVVAIRAETGADGPVARTVLGVVVLADLLVIVLFAIASSIATAVIAGSLDVGATVGAVSWELFGSLGFGVMAGTLLGAYMRLVEKGAELFVLTMCLVAAEVGQRVHLDPLLIMLSAGLFVENVMRKGAELHHAFEAASLPVYILFFTVAGASIHLDAIPAFAIPAGVLVIVRALGLYGGTVLAAQVAGAPEAVRRWAGFGLLPQAGLAIALALLFARTFPSFGQEAGTLVLGIVAINEIVAPALLRAAFVASGEAKQREPGAMPAPPPH